MSGEITFASEVIDQSVLGVGLRYPIIEDRGTGDLKVVSGHDNVISCITFLLEHRVGEKLMDEDRGTLIASLIGQNPGTEDVIRSGVKEAIERFEPRVKDVRVTLTKLSGNTLGYNVAISWKYRGSNTRGNMVYPFMLDSSEGLENAPRRRSFYRTQHPGCLFSE